MSGTLVRLLVVVALVNACLALSFVVPASREECFVEDLEKGTEVGLTYQVTEGGFLDIDVAVRSLFRQTSCRVACALCGCVGFAPSPLPL